MKRLLFLCCIGVLTLACSQVPKSKKATITVSILPHKYLAERIVGDRYQINVLTPPGANHETYEPTPRQIKELSDSHLLVINGYLMFEDNLARKFAKSATLKLVDLSSGVNLISGGVIEHGDHVHLHGIDPHFWLSPTEVRTMAQNIRDAMIGLDPDGAVVYDDNLNILLQDLDSLDIFIRESFSDLRTHTFIIYHPALGYLARDYGLNQVAIETEGKEPTVQHIMSVADLARQEGIKTVFIQSQFSIATAEAVAREIGGRVVTLDPVPENWLENMYAITNMLRNAMR